LLLWQQILFQMVKRDPERRLAGTNWLLITPKLAWILRMQPRSDVQGYPYVFFFKV